MNKNEISNQVNKLDMIKTIYSIVLIVLFAFTGYAQNTLSLSDAIRIGLENNYQIRVSEKNIEIAQNNNSWGNVGRYPNLSLSLSQANRYDERPNIYTNKTDKYYSNSLNPGISLGWNLFNGFAVSISKKNMEALVEMSEGNAALVVENTIQSIVLAYYKILLEKEKLAVVNELVKLSKDRYNYLLTKKEIGNVSSFEVLQAKNAYLTDSATVLMQSMNYRSSKTSLNILLGRDETVDYSVSDDLLIPMYDYPLNDLRAKMKSENKTLQNQYINLRILNNSTKLGKSNIYPNISLNAGTDKSYSQLSYVDEASRSSNSFDYYANFSLRFNLYNGGQTRRQIQNAKIQEEIASIQTDEIAHNLDNILANLYDLYNVRKQLVLVANENLKSSELNLSISNDKFKAGVINSFNYRDIQIVYLNTAFNRLQAIYNLIDTYTELLRITGGIINEYDK